MNALLKMGCGAALALAAYAAGAQARGEPPVAPGAMERAAALVQRGAFGPAADSLRRILSVDPSNRSAREMLAFALESTGDLEGERRVRAALAVEFQRDAGVQADYGRVLERSGDESGALRAYRRARDLSSPQQAAGIDAAIERVRGRTATEVGLPLVTVLSDPDATSWSGNVGAAIPLGSGDHVSALATHAVATDRIHAGVKSQSDLLALSLVHRTGTAGFWTVGPRLQRLSSPGSSNAEVALGGAFLGRTTLGPWLEGDLRGEVETPWDEAAVTVLRGGRATAAEGHLYAHQFDRRLVLQLGARRRELTIRAADPLSAHRPRAWQSLVLGGADLVLWSDPRGSLRGEMLDEALVAPSARSSSVTLAFRHYEVTTRSTPEFSALFGIAPRGSVDEASLLTTLVSLRRNVRLDVRGGLARDAAVEAHEWRAGGTVVWAPTSSTRFSLGYDEATNLAAGLPGRRRAGGMSLHVDF